MRRTRTNINRRYPFSLTDDQLTAVMLASKMLIPSARHPFLMRIASRVQLLEHGSVSDDVLHHAINAALNYVLEDVEG